MDEVEFAVAIGKLKRVITGMEDIEAINALTIVVEILSGLSARITELQMEEDDD